MRVALLAGSYPPDDCGVGDYSGRLVEALRALGIEVEVLTRGAWSLGAAPSVLRSIRAARPDLLHAQYPSVGFGASLAPQAIVALSRAPALVTLHEFSQARLPRKLAIFPFAARARALVFTSDDERAACRRWYPWVSRDAAVIPIGSNIPAAAGIARRPRTLAYFGLVRPGKGLEAFLAAARELRREGFEVRVVGSPDPRHRDYHAALRADPANAGLTWLAGLDPAAVAAELSAARFAYLPFPDGASARRGSLLAAMTNGCAVVTTRGAHTTDDLAAAVAAAPTPADAVAELKRLAADPGAVETLSARGRAYAARGGWRAIAEAHVALYERLLAR